MTYRTNDNDRLFLALARTSRQQRCVGCGGIAVEGGYFCSQCQDVKWRWPKETWFQRRLKEVGLTLAIICLAGPGWTAQFGAIFVDATQDRIGIDQSLLPDDAPDNHVKITGLRPQDIKRVRIEAAEGLGTWETPNNNLNWLIAIDRKETDSASLFFSQYNTIYPKRGPAPRDPASLKVIVEYVDGVIDSITGVSIPPPLTIVPPPPPPSPVTQFVSYPDYQVIVKALLKANQSTAMTTQTLSNGDSEIIFYFVPRVGDPK